MPSHLRSAALALAASAAVAGSADAANLLMNGSFETGDLSGWTVVGPNSHSLNTMRGRSDGGSIFAEDGTYFLGDGTVGQATTYSQTFADTAGATYGFSFWYYASAYSADNPATNLFASVNGVKLFEPAATDDLAWYLATGTFTGTGSDTFAFGSRNDPAGNFFDNFAVAEVTGGVPEPGVWGLMILGFGLSGAALRRRRFAVA